MSHTYDYFLLYLDVENNRKVLTKETSNSLNSTSGRNCINEMIREFCENTSFHGFSEWYRAQNVFMKTLWVIIISCSLIGTSYEVFNVINDYRRAPTSTVYEFETPDDGLIFPQVLLCNTNFLNASKVKALNYSKATVNAAKFLILNPVEDVIGSVFDPTYSYLMKNLAESDVAAAENFMPDVLEHLQYDLKEFVKACFFDQQPCEIFNVSIVEAPDAEYGVCFLVKVNSLQTKSGEGLHLVLDTHSELWWTEQPTFGHGVVVRIEKHYNPGVLRSYFVLPNYITKISLSAIHYKMLDTSNCRDDMARKIFNSNVTYSEDICRMECFFRVALKHCGCIRSMPPEYLFEANLPQCFNSTQQICLKDASVLEKFDSEAQQCKRQCLPPCDSWDYRAAISMLKFPAAPIIPVMEKMYNKSANESRFEDYVVLDIAFDQLRVICISKQTISIFCCTDSILFKYCINFSQCTKHNANRSVHVETLN